VNPETRTVPRRFHQLDVFSVVPLKGNPLAVVHAAEGLADDTLAAFARWTNLSETTFLLPPSDPHASYRVRIFTPRQELPFAGHPSIGSAHAAIDSGLAIVRDGRLVQECAAGLLPMRVDGAGPERAIFVRAPDATLVAADDKLPLLNAALAGQARGKLPPALMDNGPHWWVVELADEAAVRVMQPDFAAISQLTLGSDSVGLAAFAFCKDKPWQLAVRAFCPADGIPEDPVTGSANAAIAAWLLHNSALPARHYLASQGREVGRDGFVRVEVDGDGHAWIGGCTQTIVEGSLDW